MGLRSGEDAVMESFDDLEKRLPHREDANGAKEEGNHDPTQKDEPQEASEPPSANDDHPDGFTQALNDHGTPLWKADTERNAELGTTPYPQLSYNPQISPEFVTEGQTVDQDEEEPKIAKCFDRSASPTEIAHRNKDAFVEKVGEDGVSRMHKFSLYETATWFYLVGADLMDKRFRIMKIDRTCEPGKLNIIEDEVVYTKKETNQVLNAIDEGNKHLGGLKQRASFWGILGFIRFTSSYYMLLITKRSQVAMIGGHYVYQVEGTELIQLTPGPAAKAKVEPKNPEESRSLAILHNLDLTRSFYFSYGYDITRTLQRNILHERNALAEGKTMPLDPDHNDMFIWNHYLLKPAKKILKNIYDWCLPIIHGYIDQAALSVYWGRIVHITIIARRSRFFAGARYLKRGANDLGYVANDVETEQIVAEMLTTSFHAPGPTLYANPGWTSFVQHRGSVPLYWTQDATGVTPKPEIQLNLVDPFYSAAALHFNDLFERYGAPVYVLNLVKARERTPRESKLLTEYHNAITYLNQFLPEDRKILYKAWDMSRAQKSRDQDVIGALEEISAEIIPKIGFFRNGFSESTGQLLQNGVARTNCIDCLDRTNAAQFVIAKEALGYQLQALGVIDDAIIEYDSDAANLFTHMWHDHGDTIAVQYGGSHLVNTMSTYRKINQWSSHSRDMVESFKRFYNNSFNDGLRQEAYNLFLGNYVFTHGQPMIWELASDYYLHHSDPRALFARRRPSYRKWYDEEHLIKQEPPIAPWPLDVAHHPLSYFDDYWIEYYRPLALSSFKKIFSYKMHSNLRYIPIRSTAEGQYDLSPFKVRHAHDSDEAYNAKKQAAASKKGVKIIMPPDNETQQFKHDPKPSIDARLAAPSALHSEPKPLKPISLGPWLDAQQQMYGSSRQVTPRYTGLIKDSSFEATTLRPSVPPIPTGTSNQPTMPTKTDLATIAFTAKIQSSLSPSIRPDQLADYEQYLTHPLNMPLVLTSDVTEGNKMSKGHSDFAAYLDKTKDEAGLVCVERAAEAKREEFEECLHVGDEGLAVMPDDWEVKRYRAYRKWLRGKSIFKSAAEA